ncbi:MAG: AI-2E family transporter [Lachnospiraceae bacterium]|nr:AI-2E family transporter [Lachnospiraceae bacterium]
MGDKKNIISEGKKYIKNRKNGVDLGKYMVIAIIAFITSCAVIAFFFLIYRYNGLHLAWTKLMNILQPIIIGAVVAYLLNPVMTFIENILKKITDGVKMEEKRRTHMCRLFAVIGALVFLLILLTLLIGTMIPQLNASIRHILRTLPGEADDFSEWISVYLPEGSDVADTMVKYVDLGVKKAQEYISQTILPDADSYIANITTGVIAVLKTMLNIVIGIIISTYILFSKEHFVGMAKKSIYASFEPKVANKIIVVIRKSNEIFGGFISGKLLDSAIIGVICYICMLIMKMPYPLLIAVIVGVTNIIPFFGPYIGAVPSFVLVALTNPIKGIYFAVFIIILQQIDGNIIGPKILGDSTGISNVGVIFAILVGGGLFGIPGMIIGVPVFAVIEYLAGETINYILKKKKMSQTTDDYVALIKVDSKSGEMIYPEIKEEETEL